jgi:hypothetical protein
MRRVEQRPVFHPNLNEALGSRLPTGYPSPVTLRETRRVTAWTEQICLQLDAGDYGDSRSFGANARSRTAPRSADTTLRRSRLFGQLPGRNKLKAGSRLVVSPFPEIKFIRCCCGVL